MSPRFLLLRLSSLGDIVHALPAVAALRAAFPQARLDWVVESRWREVIELNPDVSNVLAVDTHAWRRAPLAARTWRSLAALRQTLRQACYDVAIDLQGLYKSAVLAWLSGAPKRVGFAKGCAKEPGAALFYTECVLPPANTHVIEMNLALAKAAGAREGPWQFPLPTRPEEEAEVERWLASQHLRDFVVLSPGGGWPSKCWPVERYAAVHNILARERGWRTVLNTGPGEEALANQFLAEARVTRPVLFSQSLRHLLALVRRARLLISGDSGPLHLAAAVGTPVVGLYGPTDPVRNGPPSPPARAVVLHHRQTPSNTYKHDRKPSPAMLGITVEEVVAAVNQVMESSRG